MGNASGKRETDNLYNSEELRMLESAYKNASGGALEKLTQDRLVVSQVNPVTVPRVHCENQWQLHSAFAEGSGSQVQGRAE